MRIVQEKMETTISGLGFRDILGLQVGSYQAGALSKEAKERPHMTYSLKLLVSPLISPTVVPNITPSRKSRFRSLDYSSYSHIALTRALCEPYMTLNPKTTHLGGCP